MTEQTAALIRRVIDQIWNAGDLDSMAEIYAGNVVRHNPPFPDIVGLDGYRDLVADTRKAYPDFHVTVDDVILSGSTDSVTRWVARGTHRGKSAMIPVPPTGKPINVSGGTIARWENGKVTEEWFYADWLGLLQQLGIVPPLEPPST